MTKRYYFAYGSNLNNADWEQSCRENGFDQGLLKFRSVGFLPDYDIAFTRRSARRQGGVLDIIPRLGQVVPGVIFEVDEAGWEALDRKEGAPTYYERVQPIVINDRGEQVPVTAYQVVQNRRKPFVPPAPEYVEVVRQGLEAFSLPTCALLAAAENRIPPYLITSFFFYGTLMRGASRFDLLQSFGLECILLARAAGRLVDLGSYPGLIDLTTVEHTVEGEFVRVADIAAAIPSLDKIEGFGGYGTAGSLYRRTIISVDVGEGRQRHAWAYRYARDPGHAPTIVSGNWRTHVGCRDRFLSALVAGHAGNDECRLAAEIAGRIPFSLNEDREATVAALLPLQSALARGDISERILAQHSGNWAVIPILNH